MTAAGAASIGAGALCQSIASSLFNKVKLDFWFIEVILGAMNRADLPTWVSSLDEEDLHLIRRFVLAGGSLKELAADYDVSYPTIRGRVDALIERMRKLNVNAQDDVFEAKLRLLVSEGTVLPKTGKELLRLHKLTKGE